VLGRSCALGLSWSWQRGAKVRLTCSAELPARPRTVTAREYGRAPTLATSAPAPLTNFDLERVRVIHERTYAAIIERHPLTKPVLAKLSRPSPQETRRALMAETLRLSESMAPEAYRVAHQAKAVLGIAGPLELYQRRGAENASMHFVVEPILLEIHGAILPQLDAGALLALVGHELGHYLAHGPTSASRDALVMKNVVTAVDLDDPALALAASRFSMMCELTADRVGLLACQDLEAALRLEMISISGLGAGSLTMDTQAYLAQCKELVEFELANADEGRRRHTPGARPAGLRRVAVQRDQDVSRAHRAGPWHARPRRGRRVHRSVLRTTHRHRPRPAPGRRGSAGARRVCTRRRRDRRPRRRRTL
jgi:hypothetical protein